MGTSSSSGGPGSQTPLVPSWLDNGEDDVLPNAPKEPKPLPPIPPMPPPNRFKSARKKFSAFARSGGSDRSSLRRGVRDYIRSGMGGSQNATRRMAASRIAVGNLLGVFRGFQQDGINTTLRQLNLGNLIGRPLQDLLLGLIDVVCQEGGTIDEGIARDSWLETIAELDILTIDNDSITSEGLILEIFLAFIGHTIEARIFQDIGINSFRIAADLDSIEAFEMQLRDYIRRAVRDSFSGSLAGLATFSDRQISEIVDRTYRDAWDLLVEWGDVRE